MTLKAIATAVAAATLVVAYGVPAYAADLPQADIAMVSSPTTAAAVGGLATIPITLHNYGPGSAYTGTIMFDVIAPGGTEWAQDYSSPGCATIVALHHYRCSSGFIYSPDGHTPATDGGRNGTSWTLDVTVTARCPTPGSFKAEYGGDSKHSNDTAVLKVTAANVAASECQPKPKPKPTTKPAAPRTSAAHPTEAATTVAASSPPDLTVSPTTDPTPSVLSAVLAATNDNSDGSGLKTPLLASGGVLVVAAALAFLRLARRRSRTSGDESGPAADGA